MQPTSFTVQQGMYTIWWKASCTLASEWNIPWYVLPLLVVEFYKVCTQEQLHTLGTLVWTPNPTSNKWKDAWYCLHQLQSLMSSVHNSRKKQLDTYNYKTCETRLHDSVHKSRENQLYTYLACENRPLCFYILWFLCNLRSTFMQEIWF